MTKPYDDTRPKNAQVSEMFDTIAPRYDRLNRLLSLGIDNRWRKAAQKAVLAGRPQHIVDLATGTADMAIRIARYDQTVSITAVDPSEGMLVVGKEKARRAGMGHRINFIVSEAESLKLPDRSADALCITFGIRNFSDIELSLQEISRVLKPGGRLVIAEFSTPKKGLFATIFNLYFKHVLPLVGGWVSGDKAAYKYLPSSVGEFPEPQEFVRMLEGNGFTGCRLRKMTGGVAILYTAVNR